MDIGGLSIGLPNLSNDVDEPETSKTKKKSRLEYLDGLRGILCVIVVCHHFRCAFRPCHVFATTAEWLTDASYCENVDTGWNLYLNPVLNGLFAVAVFMVMSGMVLSNGLWKAGAEQWRVAVAKRYIRLAIPIAAAFIFSYALGGTTFHKKAAEITKSVWLDKMPMERPSPVTGLLGQIGWGVWRGTSTLNNAAWTMEYELIGSYIVFLLVAMLKGSPHSVRTRWLAALFVLLLVPSSTRNHVLQARVNYDVVTTLSAVPGKKRMTKTTNRVVQLDPVKHAHVLHQIHKIASNSKDSPTLTSTFQQRSPESWSLKKDLIDGHIVVLDKPKKSHNLTNAAVFRELQAAANPENKQISSPSIEMIEVTSWKSTNPWIWYAAFVAGAWISEHVLTAASGRPMGGISIAGTPLVHGYLIFALTCASYPLTGLESGKYLRWRLMHSVANSLGLSSVAPHFWTILGAVSLVFYLAVHAECLRQWLASHRGLQFLGKISFALYLTHIPILYTVTSAVFLKLYPVLGEKEATASLIAFLTTFPVMLGVAFLFCKYVDQPAVQLSTKMGQRLLGLTDRHPSRGYSNNANFGSSNKQGPVEADTTESTVEEEM